MMRTELRAVRELRRARRLRLPFALSSQRDLDLAKWQAIHHIVFGKPAFARDANAEPQILQSLRAMSVRVDYTFNTFLFGQRPVGCARIVTKVFSIARITRAVISALFKLKTECTDAMT